MSDDRVYSIGIPVSIVFGIMIIYLTFVEFQVTFGSGVLMFFALLGYLMMLGFVSVAVGVIVAEIIIKLKDKFLQEKTS